MMRLFLPLYFLIQEAALANSLRSMDGDLSSPPIHKQDSKEMPGDRVLPQMQPSVIEKRLEEISKALREETKKLEKEAKVRQKEQTPPKEITYSKEKKKIAQIPSNPKKVPLPVKKKKEKLRTNLGKLRPNRQEVTIFSQNISTNKPELVTLPSGAHAFGRVRFGEEVTADGTSEVLVSLDYAFLGPNESVVELTGCVVWLKVESHFHTQRIKGEMQDLTCTSPSGRVFTVSLNGPLVGKARGYAGVESEVIMKGPAKAAALKFLSDITKAYGAATSAIQTRTEVVSSEKNTERVSNVEGNGGRYTAGKVIEAHGDFLQYLSSFFASMQPTLALPPGEKVHLVNRFNVAIPREFFKKGKKHG